MQAGLIGGAMAGQMKVLFLSPEAVPFAKTGGLADVAGALPDALKRLGVDVRLVLPHYREVWKSKSKLYLLLEDLKVPFGKDLLTARVWESQTDEGVPVYFIKREDMFDRPNLYGNSYGDYYDNLERFSFYCHAALRFAERISFSPDIVHCHDWQSGLVPAFIKGPYAGNSVVGQSKTIFTIHNLGYQGIFPAEKLSITGLPQETFYKPDGLEFWGNISLLKSGIFYSDNISTVSPTYALEIQTNEYGLGMAGILQQRRTSLFGILNGVDYKVWNPACDTNLKVQYTPENIAGKNRCKESLIKEMKLNQSLKSKPLLGMISRLDTQKGLDLLVKVLDDIFALDAGIVILGSGDKSIQEALEKAVKKNPGRLGLRIDFDESLAHRIMAGADMFVIPSRYEPCGLTQMYALKYGTIPIVRNTGGLKDAITAFNPSTGKGNGFKFTDYKPKKFLASIRDAISQYHKTDNWKKLRTSAMKEDFSWDRSAKSYLKLYHTMLKVK
jgi:starch synthase